MEDISWFPSHDKYNDGSEHRIKALEDQLENMRKIMSKSEELKWLVLFLFDQINKPCEIIL